MAHRLATQVHHGPSWAFCDLRSHDCSSCLQNRYSLPWVTVGEGDSANWRENPYECTTALVFVWVSFTGRPVVPFGTEPKGQSRTIKRSMKATQSEKNRWPMVCRKASFYWPIPPTMCYRHGDGDGDGNTTVMGLTLSTLAVKYGIYC